jgi:hypothetical protein
MTLAVSLNILTETLSGPVALLRINLFNAFLTPFSLILMSFTGLNGEFPFKIMDHLDNQNILNENEHGFRAKRSCESQLLMTTNDITKWMNNNIQVDIAILDALLGFNLFNAFSTPFSLILMSFIGLNDEFPFDGIISCKY